MTLIIIRFSTCVHLHHHRRRHHMGAEEAALAAAAQLTNHDQSTCLDKPTQLLTILGLLIEALLFGMFTSCMMCKSSILSFCLFRFIVEAQFRREESLTHLLNPNFLYS